MQNVENLNPTVPLDDDVMIRDVVVTNRVIAWWRTMIGKKVVMAVTGSVFALFVIGHMLGNLKAFSVPAAINAYSQFLREVGRREFSLVIGNPTISEVAAQPLPNGQSPV
jgi:succinate dehydrogenase / fumarate reductase, cytochrome b subunit